MHRSPDRYLFKLFCASFLAAKPWVSLSLDIQGVDVHRVQLRKTDSSPYCFALSSIVDLSPSNNYLATQVWPSARVASFAVEEYLDPSMVAAELGCGPGLPSLTAAARTSRQWLAALRWHSCVIFSLVCV